MKVEEIFANELTKIRDLDIREFVVACFDKLCPDYFWTCPCSTSGKYHPQYALGKGGLIRHVKSAIWWGIELSKALEMEQYHDEMVAALLLHDLIKNGKGLDANGRPLERGVTGTHGVTLAHLLTTATVDCQYTEGIERIFYGIACHMGIWTTDPSYHPTGVYVPSGFRPFANLIHLADYCASRKVDELINILQKEKSDG